MQTGNFLFPHSKFWKKKKRKKEKRLKLIHLIFSIFHYFTPFAFRTNQKKMATTVLGEITNDLFIAVDIEKDGDHLNDPILCFGTCLGTPSGQIVEKKIWYMPIADEKPRGEYWNRPENLPLYHAFRKAGAGMTIEMAVVKFVAYFNNLEERYPMINLKLVTDNPAYDIGSLDYLVHTVVGRLPLRYSSNGKYRSVIDVSQRMRALHLNDLLNTKVSKVAVHDHRPDNDAEYIYRLWVECIRAENLTMHYLTGTFFERVKNL